MHFIIDFAGGQNSFILTAHENDSQPFNTELNLLDNHEGALVLACDLLEH